MDDAKDIRVVVVPYDWSHYRWRMGDGSEHLLENGFVEALVAGGQLFSGFL